MVHFCIGFPVLPKRNIYFPGLEPNRCGKLYSEAADFYFFQNSRIHTKIINAKVLKRF